MGGDLIDGYLLIVAISCFFGLPLLIAAGIQEWHAKRKRQRDAETARLWFCTDARRFARLMNTKKKEETRCQH